MRLAELVEEPQINVTDPPSSKSKINNAKKEF
jgi:hypothetical protein